MAKGRSRPPFVLGGTSVECGTHAHVEIPVARLFTGTWLPLPVSIVHGRHDGPTIWLSAAVHGDELNGIPIIRDVVHRIDPKKMAGTVLAVPIVNAFGLINASRYLPDRRDLNRSFPGSKRGSLAARLAWLFTEEIVKHCEFGIDIHTGSQGRSNLPQIRCDTTVARIMELAEAFAAPVIMHAKKRSGSLRAAAADLGIDTLLYETGEDTRLDRKGIQDGIMGILRVLARLGMIEAPVEPPPPASIVTHNTQWMRAGRSGMCRMLASLGDTVKRDQKIAVVFDPLHRQDAAVRSRIPGIVIGRLNHALVNRGQAIAHIAEVRE